MLNVKLNVYRYGDWAKNIPLDTLQYGAYGIIVHLRCHWPSHDSQMAFTNKMFKL